MDSRLLLKLSKSKKYVLKFKKEEERIEKRGIRKGVKIGRKEGEKNKAIAMAKIMKNDGKTGEEIMRYTMLSKKQIDVL